MSTANQTHQPGRPSIFTVQDSLQRKHKGRPGFTFAVPFSRFTVMVQAQQNEGRTISAPIFSNREHGSFPLCARKYPARGATAKLLPADCVSGNIPRRCAARPRGVAG